MYLQGFGNHHQSEAITGALPTNQNSPQHCPLGLFAEQISGSAFTMPRHCNGHTWLYRLLPSVMQGAYTRHVQQIVQPYATEKPPNALRWSPLDMSQEQTQDFIGGLHHLAGTPKALVYRYCCNLSMQDNYFSNRDAEMLFIPYEGEIKLHTELGELCIAPGKIAVIPRGFFFKVELMGLEAKGYLCENSGSPLTLPHLGFMGANGLAHPRHFNYPRAAYEAGDKDSLLLCKYQNVLWSAKASHSPLNVVAWHGNYAPYSYDLSLFNTINTVSYDHPDPSIFTVLTSESATPNIANLDFVIFPPRWMVAEHTFRLPYFHRNLMSELMGLISGTYDAKKDGFLPGGVSVHNSMTPHGPDYEAYHNALGQTLAPEHYENTMGFMLESKHIWKITEQGMQHASLQRDYVECWQGFQPGVV